MFMIWDSRLEDLQLFFYWISNTDIGCCQGECNRCNRTTFRANMQTFQPQCLHSIFCHRVFVDILCLAEHKDDIMGLKDWVWFQGLQTRSIVNPNLNRPAAGPHLCDQGQDCISESLIVNETCDCVRWNGFTQDEDTLSSSVHHIQCKGWANYVRGLQLDCGTRGGGMYLRELQWWHELHVVLMAPSMSSA